MSITLYSLAAEYRGQLETLADMDLSDEALKDTLDSLGGELEAKAQATVSFARHLEKIAESIKDAERSMADRRKAIENRTSRIKQYVLEAMQNNDIQRIECPYFVLSIAKNPPSVEVLDEKQIPVDYFVDAPPPPPQLNKKLVLKAMKDGFEVTGCRLYQGVRLSIK